MAQLTSEQIALIEATADAAVSKSEARMIGMIRKELHEHERSCPKFEVGMGKLLLACICSSGGVGLVMTVIAKVWK